jgi:hypothetical protein
MTTRFSVKKSHIEDALILVFKKKQTPTVKVITVRLIFCTAIFPLTDIFCTAIYLLAEYSVNTQ